MKQIPSLRLLETFELVHHLGSMKSAAEKLNVTPPAISRSIHILEQELGFSLMDRSTKPAVPTAAGKELAHTIRKSFEIVAEKITELREEEDLSDTQLTLCCTIGMATHWLMPRLSGFYANHPGITVNIQAPPSDRPDLTRGIDIAMRYGRGVWKDGPTAKLFDELVCPVGRPDVVAKALQNGGLQTVPLIDVRNTKMNNWVTWADYIKRIGLDRPKITGEVFDNYVQAVQAALDGRGLMLGWRSITKTLVDDGKLSKWSGPELDFGTGYYISCRADRAQSPSVKSFVTWAQSAGQADILE